MSGGGGPARGAAGPGWKRNDSAGQGYQSTSPAANLLSRLEGVRETAAACWLARCPAHDDKRPSLSIRETADGALLVHCFVGCDTAAVVAAAGLTLADLFPPRPDHHQPPKSPSERRRYGQTLDALKALGWESLIVLVAAESLAVGRSLTVKDLERLQLAVHRIRAALRATT